jgi:hypothetical protein
LLRADRCEVYRRGFQGWANVVEVAEHWLEDQFIGGLQGFLQFNLETLFALLELIGVEIERSEVGSEWRCDTLAKYLINICHYYPLVGEDGLDSAMSAKSLLGVFSQKASDKIPSRCTHQSLRELQVLIENALEDLVGVA